MISFIDDDLHPALLDLPVDQALEAACHAHLGVWSERKLGLVLAPLHWEWCDLAMEWSRGCVVAPREHGKALATDTPVAVPGGFRTIGDLAVGDPVMGADGEPDVVTAVSPVYTDHDCYRVTLDDGTTVVADAEHLWWTHYAWRGRRVVTTRDIAVDLTSRGEQTHVIDPVLVELPDADLPIDPYVLGCWLGDGTSNNSGFTCADQEILDEIRAAGVTVHDRRETGGGAYAYCMGDQVRMARTDGRVMSVNNIKMALHHLGVLRNKHVPDLYLWASAKQRWALLQGLMDTDGSCSIRGQAEFGSTSRALADGVERLMASLGMKPKRCEGRAKLNGRDCGPVYRVWCYPTMPVFRLPRKLARQRVLPEGRRSKATGRAVRSCVPTLSVPVRCITTKSGGYLITDRFVLTHNSVTFAVNATVWESLSTPGLWTYIFSETMEQAQAKLAQVKATMELIAPMMMAGAFSDTLRQIEFANGSMVTVAGAGKSVRGDHPDRIIGDDVLEEESALSELGRKRMQRWWFGTVGGMAHPGTTRKVRTRWWDDRVLLRMPPTRIMLVGTPFHERDLLMSMRSNPLYRFRRYAAEFDPDQCVPGSLAVEAS